MTRFTLCAIGALALAGCNDPAAQGGGGGGGRGHIEIVGSSTVFPFAKAVAERFAQGGEGRVAPVAESTGTGGGIEEFCSGVGMDTPDIANASRRMKASEFESCQKNGVTEIVEIQVGIDGIALAQSVKGPAIRLTKAQVYRGLAATPYGQPQTAKNWSDVDPALPAIPIAVFGPPTTSGTRDAFDELIMIAGCDENADMKALKERNADEHEKVCGGIRNDSGYSAQGENDNLIVQKLVSNPQQLGIFGYSYLEANAGKVRGVPIDGVLPTYDAIAGGTYPGARPLFIYVKKAHIGKVPGLQDYINEFVGAATAQDSYLKPLGLILLPEDRRKLATDTAAALTVLTADALK
jgi:phosphate transport system substrate-binding protein